MTKKPTKQKILETALQLFVENGIDKTSTAQITKTVGVAEGTLFVHYKTKAELIKAIITDIKMRERASMQQLPLTGDAEGDIKMLSEFICAYFIERYPEYKFMEMVEMGHHIDMEALKVELQLTQPILKMARAWQQQGTIKQLDVAAMYAMVWNMCRAIIHFCLQTGKKKAPQPHIDAIWDAVRI